MGYPPMSMCDHLRPCSVRVILTVVSLALFTTACTKQPPNVVLITVDTLRADHLGCYGHQEATSPNIDKLATSGVVFTDASTTICRTTQAIASLFTSAHPSQHGVTDIGQRLAEKNLTLAEVLSGSGFQTLAISANPAAGKAQGLDQGFSSFVDRATLGQAYPIRERLDGPNPEIMGAAEAVTLEALEKIKASRRPFFLWLLYMDPHWRYNPPAPHNQVIDWSRFDFYRKLLSFKPLHATIYFNLNGLSAAHQPELKRLYDAEIRYTDLAIGQLLAGLGQRFRAEETLIVLTADHGESLGEHGYYYQHGALAYQPSMRIPLLFHHPGSVPEQLRIAQPVSLIDVAPTILSLLGLPRQAEFFGEDLSQSWSSSDGTTTLVRTTPVHGESGNIVHPANPIREIGGRKSFDLRFLRSEQWVLVEHRGELSLYDHQADPTLTQDLSKQHPDLTDQLLQQLREMPDDAGRWRMLRDGKWKLIRIPEHDGVRWELFDLENDPLELVDLSRQFPSRVSSMQEALTRIAEKAQTQPQETISDEVRRQLEQLGYVDQ